MASSSHLNPRLGVEAYENLPSDDKTENIYHKYKNLSRLVTSPNLFSHLQDLKIDVSFQWLGPHFLTFLKYAIEIFIILNRKILPWLDPVDKSFDLRRLRHLLKDLDDSASHCILYGETTEHYENFLKIILSFMPKISEFITIQNLLQLSNFKTNTIDFLLETIGELLTFGTNSSVLVSNQVEVLLKELKFLFTFLIDTMRRTKEEQNKDILKKIEALFNEAVIFLYSFFFTTDLVTATEMDLAISVLLERIKIVKEEIKCHCIAVSMNLNCGIGSLQVAKSSSEERIVGFEDMTTQIASNLLGGPNYLRIISIVGMGGLGKTTLAKKIYNHSNVRNHFDKLSWCVVSQNYQKRKLLIDILSSVSPLNRDKISEMEDEDLAEHLYKNLKGVRYLIVIDDLWDREAWDDLKRLFPDDRNGSRVLFTSRPKNVVLGISDVIIQPPLLSPIESWNLLEQNVFKREYSPLELQDIGKKIAKNCHGLPLSVIMVAGVLSTVEKTKSVWQQVAKSLSSQKANDIIPSLKLSYMYLPDHLKPCFLYLSAFKKAEEIPVQKLLLLWIAEEFIVKQEHRTLENVAEEYLMELINRNLLQVSKRKSYNGVKACTLHDLVLDMCQKIVVQDEAFLFQHQFLISKYRRGLSIDRSHRLSEALSMLYDLGKIRILDAINEENDVLKNKTMPDLRYMEISSLWSSIGSLQNLEFLLVRLMYDEPMPKFLLNMPKLRHLRIGRKFSPARLSKNCDSPQLNSLQTLSYVHIDDSEDEEILRCSPNLRSLKCRSLRNRFPDLNFLSQLESLTMSFVSGLEGNYWAVNFPMNIKKLTLYGIGLPWDKMSLIGRLPKLEILKLEDEAFIGEIWDTEDYEFQNLKFLKLDNIDLEQWNSSYDHFPRLEQLVLRYCNNLEEIPSEFGDILTLHKIEVYACGKKVEISAMQIRDEQLDCGNEEFKVIIAKASGRSSTWPAPAAARAGSAESFFR